MEKKRPISEADIISMQAEKKIRAMTKQFLSSPAISAKAKAEVLEKTTALVQDIYLASQKNIPFEVVLQQKTLAAQKSGDVVVFKPPSTQERQAPDLSEVPRWRGSKHDGTALDFLQAHYGGHLSAFGAPEDSIFMYQIRRHDKRLLTGIENQLRDEGLGRKPREFVKPKKARIDRELASFTPDDLKRAERMRAAIRKRRAQKQTNPKVISL